MLCLYFATLTQLSFHLNFSYCFFQKLCDGLSEYSFLIHYQTNVSDVTAPECMIMLASPPHPHCSAAIIRDSAGGHWHWPEEASSHADSAVMVI